VNISVTAISSISIINNIPIFLKGFYGFCDLMDVTVVCVCSELFNDSDLRVLRCIPADCGRVSTVALQVEVAVMIM